MSTKKKITILSIDGGGIRGIIPAVILQHIEKRFQTKMRKLKKNRKEYKIGQIFDFAAGTSTGGILTCMYMFPNRSKNPRFNSDEVLDFYLTHGDEIFDKNIFTRIFNLGGLSDEKYSVENLENLLEKEFEDVTIDKLLKPTLITAYDIEDRSARLFTSHDATRASKNFYVKDICRATSAAPTYFEPAKIRSLNGIPYSFIDGGMYANNPSLCAYSEAKKLKFSKLLKDKKKIDYPAAKDMIFLSLGTGEVKLPFAYKDLKDAGAIGWIKPVIDILFSSNAETNAYHVRKIFREAEDHNEEECKSICKQFYRMDPELPVNNSEMDNANPENVAVLKEEGLRYVEEHYDELEDIIQLLIENY